MNVHIVSMSEERRARLVRLGLRAPQAALKPVPAVPELVVATSEAKVVPAQPEPPAWLLNALATPAVPRTIFDVPPRIGGLVPVTRIIRETAQYYDMTVAEMLARRRERRFARARQVGMYAAKRLTTLSLPQIGRAFGGLDHTTVMHGVRIIARDIAEDPEVCDRVHGLLGILSPILFGAR